jgi:hypothetical protein
MKKTGILGRLTGVILFVAALAEIASFASAQQTYIQNGWAYGKYLYSQYFPSLKPKEDIAPSKRAMRRKVRTSCRKFGFRIVKPKCELEKSRTKRMLCKLKPGKGEIYCKSRVQ